MAENVARNNHHQLSVTSTYMLDRSFHSNIRLQSHKKAYLCLSEKR